MEGGSTLESAGFGEEKIQVTLVGKIYGKRQKGRGGGTRR